MKLGITGDEFDINRDELGIAGDELGIAGDEFGINRDEFEVTGDEIDVQRSAVYLPNFTRRIFRCALSLVSAERNPVSVAPPLPRHILSKSSAVNVESGFASSVARIRSAVVPGTDDVGTTGVDAALAISFSTASIFAVELLQPAAEPLQLLVGLKHRISRRPNGHARW